MDENHGSILPSSVSPSSYTPKSPTSRSIDRHTLRKNERALSKKSGGKKNKTSLFQKYKIPILAVGALVVVTAGVMLWRRSKANKGGDETLTGNMYDPASQQQQRAAAMMMPMMVATPQTPQGRVSSILSMNIAGVPCKVSFFADGRIEAISDRAFHQMNGNQGGPVERLASQDDRVGNAPNTWYILREIPIGQGQWIMRLKPAPTPAFVVTNAQTGKMMESFTLNYNDSRGQRCTATLVGSPDYTRAMQNRQLPPPQQQRMPSPANTDYNISNVQAQQYQQNYNGVGYPQEPAPLSPPPQQQQPYPPPQPSRPEDTRGTFRRGQAPDPRYFYQTPQQQHARAVQS